MMSELPDDVREAAVRAVRAGLEEDLAYGPDITTRATVSEAARGEGRIVARESGVLAGLPVAAIAFDQVLGPRGFQIVSALEDGSPVEPGTVVAEVFGPTRGLLTAERTALNLLTHLSGIATTTAAWVEAVEGTGVSIRDSRKTLPGLRLLEKYAVRVGGGVNHRMGLGDEALIKDNHVAAAGSVSAALAAVRQQAPGVPIEVEVDTLGQLDEVLAAGAERVLLDNFPVWQVQVAVQRRNAASPSTQLEASGGLTLDSAREYAETGVDFLAVGALTHSVRALDLGLDLA